MIETGSAPSDLLGRRSVLAGAAGLLAALAGGGIAEAKTGTAGKTAKRATRKKVTVHKATVHKTAAKKPAVKKPAVVKKPVVKKTAKKAAKKPVVAKKPVTTAPVTITPVTTTATVAPVVAPAVSAPVYPPMPAPPSLWPAVFPPAVGSQPAPGGVPLVDDQVQHLLRRVAWGPTPAATAQVHAMGAAQWIEQQLAPASIDDSACDTALAKFDLLNLSPLHLRKTLIARDDEYGWDAMQQTQMAALVRQTVSKRQLLEVMVDFWHDHLHVSFQNGNLWSTAHDYDRTVIRPNALGTFENLLLASAQHPAMMYSLNNDSSTGDNPNENYGRELMELHTVGVGAGYTETDMHQSALALTGFSVQDDGSDDFVFKPGYRYSGPLQVLGWSDPNADEEGGLAVGLSYVRYLATHPSTARHVCTKLAVRLVSDSPSSGLIDAMVAAWVAGGTAIVPVLRVVLSSNEFWTSPGAKLRRPQEWAVATMRALGYAPTADTVTDAWGDLVWELGEIGQSPMAWGPPNGYPDVAMAWLSAATTLGAWNLAVGLAGGWYADGTKGISMTPGTWQAQLGGAQPTTGGELVDRLSLALIGQLLPDPARGAAASVGSMTVTTALTSRNTWLLSPGNVMNIAATILCSPAWRLR